MAVFATKTLPTLDTLGELLQRTRAAAGLSLADAAQQTSVPTRYLAALEQGHYHLLPGQVYAVHFLQAYAALLRLPFDQLRGQLQQEQAVVQSPTSTRRHWLPDGHAARHYSAPQLVRWSALGLSSLTLVTYLGWQGWRLTRPPELTVLQPAADLVTGQQELLVIGRVDADALLALNRSAISADADGAFRSAVTLSAGLNTLEFTAQRRHSRPAKLTRRVILNAAAATVDRLTAEGNPTSGSARSAANAGNGLN